MDVFEVTINAKDLRRAAIAVGFGLTVGKTIGHLVSGVINGATTEVIKSLAKHGNKAAQETCDQNNIKYADVNVGNDPRQ